MLLKEICGLYFDAVQKHLYKISLSRSILHVYTWSNLYLKNQNKYYDSSKKIALTANFYRTIAKLWTIRSIFFTQCSYY